MVPLFVLAPIISNVLNRASDRASSTISWNVDLNCLNRTIQTIPCLFPKWELMELDVRVTKLLRKVKG